MDLGMIPRSVYRSTPPVIVKDFPLPVCTQQQGHLRYIIKNQVSLQMNHIIYTTVTHHILHQECHGGDTIRKHTRQGKATQGKQDKEDKTRQGRQGKHDKPDKTRQSRQGKPGNTRQHKSIILYICNITKVSSPVHMQI